MMLITLCRSVLRSFKTFHLAESCERNTGRFPPYNVDMQNMSANSGLFTYQADRTQLSGVMFQPNISVQYSLSF